MDAPRRQARARVASATRTARRAGTPEAAEELRNARRDYAAASLQEYIRRMVDEFPPLTAEQLDVLRGLLDPPRRAVKKGNRFTSPGVAIQPRQ